MKERRGLVLEGLVSFEGDLVWEFSFLTFLPDLTGDLLGDFTGLAVLIFSPFFSGEIKKSASAYFDGERTFVES